MTYLPVTNAIEHFASITKEVMEEDPINQLNLGKILLASMRRLPKYGTSQIDAATGKEESIGSVLERSILTGQALRKFGIKVGDCVCVMGRNHLDVIIPFYASIFIGAPIFGLDMNLKNVEHKIMLKIGRPKIVFCEADNVSTLGELSEELGFKIVTFTKLFDSQYPSFQEFLAANSVSETVEEFQAGSFDPAETTCLVCCTSGSTGLPKLSNITHANITPLMAYFWTAEGPGVNLRKQVQLVTILAPVFWFTMKLGHILTALYGVAKVQSSANMSIETVIHIINTYKPHMTAMTPVMAYKLLKTPDAVDWTCIRTFMMAGNPCSESLVDTLNKLIGRPAVSNMYGLTEASGRVFWKNENVRGALGQIIPTMQARVVDKETGKDMPDGERGELWIKGPNVCKGYYNDKENTDASFTSDGWFKTGDLVYRNENQHYFYVDRMKCMLSTVVDNALYHISPGAIENEVKKINGVLDCVVTGVNMGDESLPIAVVVKDNGSTVTEKQIVEYIQQTLSKKHHLTGGVMFVDSLPLLSAGKINLIKIREMANEHYKAQKSNL